MQPRHVAAGGVCAHELRLDLVEVERCGVDDAGAGRAQREKLRRHDRAGIEADRAARDEVAPAHGDEIGRAGAGADEMHGHGATPAVGERAGGGPHRDARRDQARRRPARRERRRFRDRRHAGQREDAFRPRRGAGALPPRDRPGRREPAARRWNAAAAAMPGSLALGRRCRDDAGPPRCPSPARASAAAIAASISAAAVPLRHPMPATIMASPRPIASPASPDATPSVIANRENGRSARRARSRS